MWDYNMSDFGYIRISFNESKKIENNCEHMQTIFYGDDMHKTFFMKDGSKIELKYEYFFDEENNENCIVYRKIE